MNTLINVLFFIFPLYNSIDAIVPPKVNLDKTAKAYKVVKMHGAGFCCSSVPAAPAEETHLFPKCVSSAPQDTMNYLEMRCS